MTAGKRLQINEHPINGCLFLASGFRGRGRVIDRLQQVLTGVKLGSVLFGLIDALLVFLQRLGLFLGVPGLRSVLLLLRGAAAGS